MKGKGKGWAKGRSASNDPRIARNAQRHVGLSYRPHLEPDKDRRHLLGGGITTLPLEWSDEMAYIVGLTATDGCLVTGRRKINFKSADRELVVTYLRLLGRSNRVKIQKTRIGGVAYFTEFGDARLYRWFVDVGLMPRKSLVLGAIDVPDEFLFPTLRGLFDGDGHIQNFIHRPTVTAAPNYLYERLWVFFNSASRPHLEWIRERVSVVLGRDGYIEQRTARPGRHDFFRLKYGKHASIALLTAMYPSPDLPKLDRKWHVWLDYQVRHGLQERRSGDVAAVSSVVL